MEMSLDEVGLPALLSVVSTLRRCGAPVAVLDADDLNRDPRVMLRRLCAALELPWPDNDGERGSRALSLSLTNLK